MKTELMKEWAHIPKTNPNLLGIPFEDYLVKKIQELNTELAKAEDLIKHNADGWINAVKEKDDLKKAYELEQEHNIELVERIQDLEDTLGLKNNS